MLWLMIFLYATILVIVVACYVLMKLEKVWTGESFSLKYSNFYERFIRSSVYNLLLDWTASVYFNSLQFAQLLSLSLDISFTVAWLVYR